MSTERTLADLNPPLNIKKITSDDQLSELSYFFKNTKDFGFDVETNVAPRFTERKVRTIQVGNRDVQFVVDLLGLAGSSSNLQQQGGFIAPRWAEGLVSVLREGLESPEHTKVGSNIQFDYEMMKWCLGVRPYHLYDCQLVERIIYCGRVGAFVKDFWALDDMVLRYLNFRVSKELQKSFDLETELTEKQWQYSALDTRLPLAVRQCQTPTVVKAGLSKVVEIENEAVPSFGDLHVNGIYLDRDAWVEIVARTEERHKEHVKVLDTFFLPVVGNKEKPYVDLDGLERVWRDEKDKEARKEHRKAYQEAARTIRKWETASLKWEGEAAINYGSTDQLLVGLRKMGLSEKKLPDTNDKTLQTLAGTYPVIKALQNYRETAKVDSTYGVQFVDDNINPATGRVHSKFNQVGADTGRSSSSGPNMQNIPNGEWRGCFKARKGYKLITVDMSGAELRITAEASGEPSWVDAFSKGIDVHSVCAQMMMADKWDAATEEGCSFKSHGTQCSCPGHKKIRKWAKAINFGVMYGKEFRALADDLGITKEEAKQLLANWRATFKMVQAYLAASGEYAKMHLCSRTMSGRRRLFTRPDWDAARRLTQEQFEEDGKNPLSVTSSDISRTLKGMYARIDRQGKNTPIQGTNADIIKIAMALMWPILEPLYGALIVAMIHDEVVFECPEEHAETVFQIIMDCIRKAGAVLMKVVVMEADGKISDTWSK